MKYEDYEAIATNVSADNAVDVVRSMLEKAQTDAVEYDAEIADLNNKLTESENKYKALQVDYIQKFTSNSAEDKNEEDEEENVEEAIEAILSEM